MTSHSEDRQRKENLINDAEFQSWGPVREGGMMDYVFSHSYDPWEGYDGPCGYNSHMRNLFVNAAPVNDSIVQSHMEWVDNNKPWSGTSANMQLAPVPVLNWRGLRLPQPVPQSCNRAELTEYGPGDLTYFVGSQVKKCDNPVLNPQEMAGMGRAQALGEALGLTDAQVMVQAAGLLPFSLYGF